MIPALLFILLALGNDDVIHEYDRRAQVVSEQLSRRMDRIRVRMRALYKLQRGGYARLLAESSSRKELYARRAAATQILRRDLAELRLFARERQTLSQERARLASYTQAGAGDGAILTLAPPVSGHFTVLGHFGPYTEPDSGLELDRRGLLLKVGAHALAQASAHGQVVFAGPLPGLGQVVIVRHDGDFYTVFGLLGELRVKADDRVAPGDPLGTVPSGKVLFEVRRGATPLDPEPLLRHTSRR